MSGSKKPVVVDLFRPNGPAPASPEPKLSVSHLIRSKPATDHVTSAAPVDLTGKRRLLFVVGLGATGKTTWLRWACERWRDRENHEPFALATADTQNRDLVDYFDDVMEAPVEGTTQWLEKFMAWVMAGNTSGAINFGGSDTSLAILAQEVPNLPAVLSANGVAPVLLAFLSPRLADLTAYQVLAEVGFIPAATALVCNLGTVTGGQSADARAFEDITGHSIFRGAVDRGAVHIWMPRLYSIAPAIERARASFAAAVHGEAKRQVLDIMGRMRLAAWLKEMDAAFAPIASWLP